MSAHVFVNRTLNMKRISHIGLDMDHTLVRYKSANFEGLAHKIMLEKLVRDKGYPQAILKLKFNWNLAIRGLVIDRARGNLLKLSRHAAIRQSSHGTEPIRYDQQKKIYHSTYIDLKDKAFDKVDTTFSISYAALYAQLVDLKNGDKKLLPDYIKLAEDLNFVLDAAHRDGSLKNTVRDDLSRFIIKDKESVAGLERYTKHGKKIFIVTNSDIEYSSLLLDYAITPLLKSHDTWQDLFTFVITSARKPSFFFESTPFRKIDVKTKKVEELVGPLTPGVYEGGCATQFTNDLALDPEQILYIGDHIYGDIVRLKKDCAWRTALVVEELEDEIANIRKATPIQNKINSLMDRKVPLETQIDDLISKRIETGSQKNEKKIDGLIKKSMAIDKQISPLIKKTQNIYNKYWGEVMRTGIEESYFAYQVDRFACIYMTRLSDLLAMSPRTYFRSHKRLLPHEVPGN
jgi:HAD superfamily 5'-nucleotidase-like hydrolase